MANDFKSYHSNQSGKLIEKGFYVVSARSASTSLLILWFDRLSAPMQLCALCMCDSCMDAFNDERSVFKMVQIAFFLFFS